MPLPNLIVGSLGHEKLFEHGASTILLVVLQGLRGSKEAAPPHEYSSKDPCSSY